MPKKKHTVEFFGAQYDAFNFTTQFAVACAGVQSGKTFLGAHWILKKMTEFPKANGIITAPTYKILQSATLKKLFEIAPQMMSWYKEQKGEIQLPTGGTIFIRSMDDPLKAEGITASYIWGDELGQSGIMAWTVLRSRVSMTQGQILITTTPYNMGWLYTDFFVPWKDKHDLNLSFYTWKSIDNPWYPQDYYDAEQKRLTPEEFARRYMGEFRKMSGLVWDLPSENVIEPINPIIKTDARIIGVDWGYKNPAAVVVIYLKDQKWYIVDEWKKKERTTPEIIQVIQNKFREHLVTRIYADPAEPDRIEECRRAGLPIFDTNKDVTGGLSYISQAIRENRFFVTKNCVDTLDEFSMYHWVEPDPDSHKPDKEEPEKEFDHLCDAIRYGIFSYKPMKNLNKASAPVRDYYPDLGI